MKFTTILTLRNRCLCSALLLATGVVGVAGCDSGTSTPVTSTGGSSGIIAASGGSSGGAAGAAAGGSISATGGATGSGTGGAPAVTGGSIGGAPGTGGAGKGGTSGNGGASNGTGGGSGGASSGTGGGSGGTSSSLGGTSASGGTTGTPGKGGSSGAPDGGTGTGGAGPFPDAGAVDPSKKITVWMVGDSTMQNCSGTGQCGWAAEFQQYFGPNATISNQARGGRSIQTWIWGDPNVSKDTPTTAGGECTVIDKTTYSDNLTTMLDPTKGMQPGDWVYVAFGINDGTATCNRHVGSALFQSDLDFMATTIRSKGANPIFGTSTSGQSCSGSTNVANRGFGPETKAAGTADNVPVVDLTTLSVALYNSLKLCPSGSTTFWFDGTHFKTDGATQVAGVVAKALKDQGIGLAAYLK
jgi:lysophospholipase L1-like esterase